MLAYPEYPHGHCVFLHSRISCSKRDVLVADFLTLMLWLQLYSGITL